jgi:ubiquinol-cytochrome c reductase cytochrome c1 subunit
MMRRIFAPLLAAGLLFCVQAQADDTLAPLHFQSDGVFGSFDKAAAQRGFLVYQTVCASCHSARELHYRDLQALGFTPDQVAGIAAGVKLANGSPATLDDVFKNPHAPAAAFGGAVPPDLSNIVNARPRGAHYVYDLLTGYSAAPAGVPLLPGHYFNTAYPGNQIAMPAPLRANAVRYADGTPATAPQEAADVSEFLAWAADPNLTARHEIGLRAVLFLVFLTVIAVISKRRVWRETV